MNANLPAAENDDQLPDDLETQEQKIADQLAELSLAEVLPAGFRSASDTFESSDVDFKSSAWLLRLLQVQPWLCPDSEVDLKLAERAPLDCAKEFFSAIGAQSSSTCVRELNGVVRLTIEGADLLAARLDTATSLQLAFAESLEALNRKQATAKWIEAWEEEAEVDATAPELISAKSEVWRISDFSGKASKGLLNLSPSYQRGDVWPTRDAQKLIESILRGIPLPSIILLKPARTSQNGMYEVVDGKQRLTAILRFIGKHPRAIETVKAMDKRFPDAKFFENFRSDYKKFRRLWKTTLGEVLSEKREAEYYFPFRLAQSSPAFRGSLAPLSGKYYYEISDKKVSIGEGQETVSTVFEESGDYKIPLIEYLEATPKQIHEVFHLYNRQGKHLNAEEIRNALYHDVDLVRLVLVASGDNPAVEALAPYIPIVERPLLENIARSLSDFRFGSARYRRTKLLSWLLALLFQPASTSPSELTIRSTAKQIDTLFNSIRNGFDDGRQHPLASRGALVELVRRLNDCLEAHSSADCWDGRFKDDDKGQKWQELQLVASLVGVYLIGESGAEVTSALDKYRNELLEFTRRNPRPEKTQNKTQWAYIGHVALGILEIAQVDLDRLDIQLSEKFSVSCVQTLRAASALHKPRSAE